MQISAMSSSSSRGTRDVWIWMSVFWFMSAVDAGGGPFMNLETPSEVLASCGDNVTLTCNVTSALGPLDVHLLAWLDGKDKVCVHGGDPPAPDVLCESEAGSRYLLSVTFLNASAVRGGKYICKVRTTQGDASGSTVLRMQGCLGRFDSSVSVSRAECWFDGVNPGSTVHWFQEEDNLTHRAFTTETVDEQGLYRVSSTLDLENQNQAVNCSLWGHVDNKYIATQQVRSTSAGSVRLWWIWVLVEAVMLKSVV